jgi:hypothetical protein
MSSGTSTGGLTRAPPNGQTGRSNVHTPSTSPKSTRLGGRPAEPGSEGAAEKLKRSDGRVRCREPGRASAPDAALLTVGRVPRELGSSRGEALQGCVCWRSPRGFPTRAAVDSGIANEYADERLNYRPAAGAAQGRCVSI